MTLNLCSTCFSRFSFSSNKISYQSNSFTSSNHNTALFYFILSHEPISSRNFTLSASGRAKASLNKAIESSVVELLDNDDDDELISRVSAVKDANEALEVIAEMTKRSGGVLPQGTADAVAIRQQLLSQYDTLQIRIKDLKQSAENEVWMLARMCQLENKIFAVGEPSYRARRNRVKKVREGLENSLKSRIELIESYARISSMIEIEVEMDSDVLAAESASNVETVAEQIEQIMELENLEEKWRLQAEVNDEVERLLRTEPLPTEPDTDR